MRNIRRLFILHEVIFILVFELAIQGQNTVPATGGNATGTGGNTSYTVGQVAYKAYVGTTGSAIYGVQQPFEISIVTSIEQIEEITLVCSAYPNPSNDLITLKVENYRKENLSCQLLNSNGNILESKKILGNETVISLKRFPASLYFLKIIDDHREIKTFKIIKN